MLFLASPCFLERCLFEQVGLRTVVMRKSECKTEETITDEERNCIRSELRDVGVKFLVTLRKVTVMETVVQKFRL